MPHPQLLVSQAIVPRRIRIRREPIRPMPCELRKVGNLVLICSTSNEVMGNGSGTVFSVSPVHALKNVGCAAVQTDAAASGELSIHVPYEQRVPESVDGAYAGALFGKHSSFERLF